MANQKPAQKSKRRRPPARKPKPAKVSGAIMKFVEGRMEALFDRVHNLIRAVGIGVDREIVDLREGMARIDQNQLLFQRLINEAVSRAQIRVYVDHSMGEEFNAVDWGWYDRQLSASLCLEGVLHRSLMTSPPEDPEDPASVLEAALRGLVKCLDLNELLEAEIDFVVPGVLTYGVATNKGLCAFLASSTVVEGGEPQHAVYIDKAVFENLTKQDFTMAFTQGKIRFKDKSPGVPEEAPDTAQIFFHLFRCRVDPPSEDAKTEGSVVLPSEDDVEEFGGDQAPGLVTDPRS